MYESQDIASMQCLLLVDWRAVFTLQCKKIMLQRMKAVGLRREIAQGNDVQVIVYDLGREIAQGNDVQVIVYDLGREIARDRDVQVIVYELGCAQYDDDPKNHYIFNYEQCNSLPKYEHMIAFLFFVCTMV